MQASHLNRAASNEKREGMPLPPPKRKPALPAKPSLPTKPSGLQSRLNSKRSTNSGTPASEAIARPPSVELEQQAAAGIITTSPIKGTKPTGLSEIVALAKLTGTTIPTKATEDVDDLATLTKLDDPILCDQLKQRYAKDKIYTYVGDILVAVNPFRPLGIYTKDSQKLYRQSGRTSNPPHIFAIADAAFTHMLKSNGTESQCCVVSGESGAGKTESAKYVIRQLMLLSSLRQDEQNESSTSSTTTSGDLENKILAVNPLLEAFGNAQTEKNDNSSRFGKYTELVFEPQGKVLGSDISIYLLEKSRVTAPGGENDSEQNFHMFYYLLAQTADPTQYGLDPEKDYKFLSNVDGLDEIDLDAEYDAVVKAMQDVGFEQDEQAAVWSVLSAVLQLGQVEFVASGEWAAFHEGSLPLMANVARALGVDAEKLKKVLLTRMIHAAGESVQKQYTVVEASACRDAMCRALYGRLFTWIVLNINQLLCPPPAPKRMRGAVRKGPQDDIRPTIGILDIFGFEDFKVNSFEQLCINLANEQLQFFFNEHVFELEQREYAREGIDAAKISYANNKPLLEMHLGHGEESKGKIGLFALLDESSLMTRTTAKDLVNRFNQQFKDNDCYRKKVGPAPEFTIVHYAGDVLYDAEHFIEKNRDALAHDVVSCVQESDKHVIAELFLCEVNPKTGAVDAIISRADSQTARKSKLKAARASFTGGAHKRPVTMGTQFRVSLNLLYQKMSTCRPHFVRCIKPNTGKEPWTFQDDFVMKQLQYTGMLATTRIRREGYAVRPPFEEFIKRFRVLGFDRGEELEYNATNCFTILQAAGISEALIGKTKVFLKHYHMDMLEARLLELAIAATMVQKWYRGYKERKRHKERLRNIAIQQQLAEQMLGDIANQSMHVATKVKAQRDEDLARVHELKRQLADEKRRQAEQREREQAMRIEMEKKKKLEERKQVETEANASLERIEQLSTAIRSAASSKQDTRPHVEELSKFIEAKEKSVGDQSSGIKDRLSQLRVDMGLCEQAVAEAGEDRDKLIHQLTAKALYGGANASDHIKKLEERLAEQESKINKLVFEQKKKGMECDAEGELLELLLGCHSRVMSAATNALNEANQLAILAFNEQATLAGQASANVTQMQQQHGQQVQTLNANLAAANKRLSELESEVASQAVTTQRVREEKESSVHQMQKVLEEAEMEVSALKTTIAEHKAKLEEQTATATKMEQDQKLLVTQLEQQFKEQHESLQAQMTSSDKVLSDKIRKLEVENSSLRDDLEKSEQKLGQAKDISRTEQSRLHAEIDAKLAEIDSLTASLMRAERMVQSQMADKEDALGSLESKAAALATEREQATAQQIELRSQLRTTQRELEESQALVEKLQTLEAKREAMQNSSQQESSTVSQELRRLLEEKTAIVKLRDDEHENMKAKYEQVIAEQRNQLAVLEEENVTTIDDYKSQLRKKERYISSKLAEKDGIIQDSEAKVAQLTMDYESAEVQCKEVKSELQDAKRLNTRLESQLKTTVSLLDQLKAESLSTMTELSRIMTERTTAGNKKATLENEGRVEKEREVKALQSQLTGANATMKRQKAEYQRYVEQMQQDHDDQINKLEAALASQKQMMSEHTSRENALRDRIQKLSEQNAEYVVTLKQNSVELDLLREELGDATLRERRERERSHTMHAQAMKDLEGRLSSQTEAQKRNFMKLKKAIVAMARKRPEDSTPGEGAHVDLLNYITMVKGEEGIPHEMRIDRFTCKSYLTKLAADKEQRRWVVLDLQAKTMSWFVDNRELRISRKGQVALADVTKAVDPGNKDSQQSRAFMVGIHKRTYTFIADSVELKDCWMQVLRCILGQG